jgi:alpha-beta hydrolase superfamily lysophospholipase
MAALVAHSHQLAAADGTSLYVSDTLLPVASARGGMVIMHGLGEHSGRYRQLAQRLNDAGWSVRCYDQRGHGRSQGPRGDCPNGTPLLLDAQIVIDDFTSRTGLRPFLLGHSMGGLFAARLALAGLTPLRGLILSSPALALRLSPLETALLRVMERIAPRTGLPNGLPLRYLSHDASVIAAYKADPLVHGRISARRLRSMLGAVDYCHAHAATLAIPALLLVAGDDHLVDAEGSRRLFAALPPGRAQLQVYDGMYHELFNDSGAARPLSDLRDWLRTQATGAAAYEAL